jgi:hypothetical protein
MRTLRMKALKRALSVAGAERHVVFPEPNQPAFTTNRYHVANVFRRHNVKTRCIALGPSNAPPTPLCRQHAERLQRAENASLSMLQQGAWKAAIRYCKNASTLTAFAPLERSSPWATLRPGSLPPCKSGMYSLESARMEVPRVSGRAPVGDPLSL